MTKITRSDVIRAIPADDLPEFSEAICDAAYYLANALDSIPLDDAIDARAAELQTALQILNAYATLANRAVKQSEETLDFSGIEKAIASENPQASIRGLMLSEFNKGAA